MFDFTQASTPVSDVAIALHSEATAKTGATNIKNIAVGRSDLFRLNPFSIKIKDGWNSRDLSSPENQEHVTMLANSIAEIGVQEPLTVYMDGETPILTDGHCRLAATFHAINHLGADIKSIPVKTEARGADERDRLLSQLVRNSGKRLTPLEQGSVFKRLVDLGWSVEQIAAKTGTNPQLVARYLDLRSAPLEVQEMVSKGEVSATLAIAVLADKGATKATETLTAAVTEAKASGKRKATAKNLDSDAPKKPKAAKADTQAVEMLRALHASLEAVLLHMPEYDSEMEPAFARAHRAAIEMAAQAEEFLD